jgi:hypothetical protein
MELSESRLRKNIYQRSLNLFVAIIYIFIASLAIVVTDIETKPYYQKNNPRTSYISAKAD